MGWEEEIKTWAPVVAAGFAALTAGAAWRNAWLSGQAQERDLRGRRAYVVVRDVEIERIGSPARSRLAFRLANPGDRAAYGVGGHTLAMAEHLVGTPQIAAFSVANDIPPSWNALVRPEGLVLDQGFERAYIMVVVSYTDATLKESFTIPFTFWKQAQPELAAQATAGGTQFREAPIAIRDCSLEEEERITIYVSGWLPGLLKNGSYEDQVKVVDQYRQSRGKPL